MAIDLENLWFFALFGPVFLIAWYFLARIEGKKYRYLRYLIVIAVLFLTRLFLVIFDLGVFPNLEYDPLFYALALVFGILFTFYYLQKIEHFYSFEQMGWRFETVSSKQRSQVRDILNHLFIGLIGGIIILLMAALLTGLVEPVDLSALTFTLDKIITVILFALGGIYEEGFFRGLLQTDFTEKYGSIQANLYQALAFLAIHTFYFPFSFLGLVNYLVIFIMALILGLIKAKYSLYASSVAHSFFVLMAGLLV